MRGGGGGGHWGREMAMCSILFIVRVCMCVFVRDRGGGGGKGWRECGYGPPENTDILAVRRRIHVGGREILC